MWKTTVSEVEPAGCIRPATADDLPAINAIYAYARRFMAENGNPTQWGTHFPPPALLQQDIAAGHLYVIEQDGQPHGVFALIIGPDPSYAVIRDGAWLSDTTYGTIHRIAGDGRVHGLLTLAVNYAAGQIRHLRIDTHENNRIMQHLIEKNGFTRCGIIHTDDGTPRIAYERL